MQSSFRTKQQIIPITHEQARRRSNSIGQRLRWLLPGIFLLLCLHGQTLAAPWRPYPVACDSTDHCPQEPSPGRGRPAPTPPPAATPRRLAVLPFLGVKFDLPEPPAPE
ncbi:MAG: hypothetical protein WBD79_11850, partial [Anaerolineae bacterium]